MSDRNPQKFVTDVLQDMRSRNLLPVAVLLVVAIIAVPVLISGSGGEEATPATSASHDAAELAPEGQSAVLAYAPGLREYKSRLNKLSAKDPFRQQYAPPAEAATEALGTDTGTGTGDTGTGEALPTDTGGGGTSGGSGGGSKKKKTKTKTTTKYYVYDTDVLAGEAGTALARYNRIQQFTMLPSQDAPVLVFLGLAANNTQAIFLVSKEVTGVGGAGTCYPDASSCQLLGLAVGGAAELAYSVTGKTYRVELARIKRRTSSTHG